MAVMQERLTQLSVISTGLRGACCCFRSCLILLEHLLDATQRLPGTLFILDQ